LVPFNLPAAATAAEQVAFGKSAEPPGNVVAGFDPATPINPAPRFNFRGRRQARRRL